MSLNFLRIRNLRCLKDTESIDLRPLTILVGTNSSGKSTFLRTFPLLRQSVETPTTGPILWYGRYVDFGTFTQAVRRGTHPAIITLEFGVTVKRNFDVEAESQFWYRYGADAILDDLELSISLSLGETNNEQKTYTKGIEIRFAEDCISLEADEEGNLTKFQINEFDGTEYAIKFRLIPSDNLLPTIVLRPESGKSTERVSRRSRWTGPFENLLGQAFEPLFAQQINPEKRLELAHAIGLGLPDSQLQQLRRYASGGNVYARKVANLKTHDKLFRHIRNLVFATALPDFLRQVDELLAIHFRQVRYIAPVRATAERYYRQQDLSVAEVDPQGANLAMFLQSLSWSEKEQFSNWCVEQLGFSVRARTEGAHISLVLKDIGSNSEYNIADMGFGFSQILPVLAQVWSMAKAGRRVAFRNIGPRFFRQENDMNRVGDIIAIEQPELHLHPRLQARVADMFAAASSLARSANRPLSIVCETHSEAIINRIGYMVSRGTLAASDVQILLFEKETPDSETRVRKATYREDGVLENWPFGFFLAATDDEGELSSSNALNLR